MIVEGLRSARSAALWLAGPADWLWRVGTGRPNLPPLWLRRHTGPLRDFESSAQALTRLIDDLKLWPETGTVLDAGCGAGSMVPAIASRLGPAGRYVGFDVHAASLRWCRRRYAGDSRLRFELAAVASAYGDPRGNLANGEYRFPLADGQADLVLAKSLFTHLMRDEAARYLSETRRVLRPGRPAIVTAFLFEDADAGATPDAVSREFPHADALAGVRFRSRVRPSAAVAYSRAEFGRLVQQAGLHVQWLSPGFYPGASPVTGQDTLLLGH